MQQIDATDTKRRNQLKIYKTPDLPYLHDVWMDTQSKITTT